MSRRRFLCSSNVVPQTARDARVEHSGLLPFRFSVRRRRGTAGAVAVCRAWPGLDTYIHMGIESTRVRCLHASLSSSSSCALHTQHARAHLERRRRRRLRRVLTSASRLAAAMGTTLEHIIAWVGSNRTRTHCRACYLNGFIKVGCK